MVPSLLLATLLAVQSADKPAPHAQTVAAAVEEKPLPEIKALMKSVAIKESGIVRSRDNYMYRLEEIFDQEGKHGSTEKRHDVYEVQVFGGVAVSKLIEHEGKPLSEKDQRKEDEKADKKLRELKEAQARAEAAGHTSPPMKDGASLDRILEIGAFSNERRLDWHGRPTIALDYTGNPKARTNNMTEKIFSLIAGTVWIDEATQTMVHIEGHFVDGFKVGGGLMAKIQQGTTFMTDRTLVDGIWMSNKVEAHGSMRVLLLVSFSGTYRARYFDFHKFGTSSTILPGVTKVEQTPEAPEAVPAK